MNTMLDRSYIVTISDGDPRAVAGKGGRINAIENQYYSMRRALSAAKEALRQGHFVTIREERWNDEEEPVK